MAGATVHHRRQRIAAACTTARSAQVSGTVAHREARVSDRMVERILLVAGLTAMASACHAPLPRDPSRGHLAEHARVGTSGIPEPVRRAPFVPPPSPRAPQETYTVVVNEVPAKALLFRARTRRIHRCRHPSVDRGLRHPQRPRSAPRLDPRPRQPFSSASGTVTVTECSWSSRTSRCCGAIESTT